jgi:hypothetical protein
VDLAILRSALSGDTVADVVRQMQQRALYSRRFLSVVFAITADEEVKVRKCFVSRASKQRDCLQKRIESLHDIESLHYLWFLSLQALCGVEQQHASRFFTIDHLWAFRTLLPSAV